MSARSVDEERASIHMALDRMYEGYDEMSELLDDLLRAHAHELAEQIRAHADAHTKPGSVGYAGIVTGANMIDPEVSA
jgi:hypothetical protein